MYLLPISHYAKVDLLVSYPFVDKSGGTSTYITGDTIPSFDVIEEVYLRIEKDLELLSFELNGGGVILNRATISDLHEKVVSRRTAPHKVYNITSFVEPILRYNFLIKNAKLFLTFHLGSNPTGRTVELIYRNKTTRSNFTKRNVDISFPYPNGMKEEYILEMKKNGCSSTKIPDNAEIFIYRGTIVSKYLSLYQELGANLTQPLTRIGSLMPIVVRHIEEPSKVPFNNANTRHYSTDCYR